MKQNDTFEQVTQGYSEGIQTIARETRALIHKVLPEVVEVVWLRQKNIGFGTGLKKKTEHFCWLMPAKNHVTLGFNYGAELPDPKQLLEGTGKLFRHHKLRTVADVSNPDLLALLTFASSYRVPPIKN